MKNFVILATLAVLTLSCERDSSSSSLSIDFPEHSTGAGICHADGNSTLVTTAVFDGQFYCVLIAHTKDEGGPSLGMIMPEEGVIRAAIDKRPFQLPGPGIYTLSDDSDNLELVEVSNLEQYPERVRKYLSEQADAGQLAARPGLKSEGSDKPQPESEGRSR